VRGLITRNQGEFSLLNASISAPTRTILYERAATPVPTVFERCYSDVVTGQSYHIALLAFHTHVGSGSTPKPPATTCGDPGGSEHINLHFDECVPTETPVCNDCNFPYVNYNSYIALRRIYLTQIKSYHGFQYTNANQETCFCVYDSVSKKAEFDRCFTCLTPECVKDEVLVLVSDVKGMAVDIWTDLVDLPLPEKIAIAVVFVAALLLFLPLILGSVATAGVVISAEAIDAAVAALGASIAAALGIPLPV